MLPGIGKVERLNFRKEGEFFLAQFAINGILCPPVSCHASIPTESKWTDEKLMDYLIANSETMLKIYGPANGGRTLDPSICEEMAQRGEFAFA